MKRSMTRAATLAAVTLAAAAVATEGTEAPDARCPWGRLADGQGRMVRCISQNEAAWLRLKTSRSDPAPATTRAAPATSAAAGATAAPAASAAHPDAGATPGDAADAGVRAGPLPRVVAEAVQVEQGTLPHALDKLRQPVERYAKCVAEHGGLARDVGEVHVKFLVRQRGRAEGVEVVKRRSVSREAAQCIADVVDRRGVGAPSVEMTGATLVLRVEKGLP